MPNGAKMNLTSIAFIPDGNRRYAEQNRISLLKSYQAGTRKAWDVLEWLTKYPAIKTGTFYTLSLENFHNRSSLELRALFRIFEHELDSIKSKAIVEREKIRFKFLGRTGLFPKKIQEKITAAEELTAGNKKHTVNLAIGYNGQAEIVDAAKKLAEDYKARNISLESIDEKAFRNYLYDSFPEPDLLIRTSGTKRLSGFLTYQSAYSELCFIDKHWPEFSEADLDSAISEYESRERRFGR